MTASAADLRVALISIHSCPLAHPGSRDTGGMSVHIRSLTRELARQGVKVDIFTRHHDPSAEIAWQTPENANLIHLGANGVGEVAKDNLYHHLPELSRLMRAQVERSGASYDLIHSHYWLSGCMAERLKTEWGLPHLATFHTLGRIKNRVGLGELEPPLRLRAEGEIMASADRVQAFNEAEQEQMATLYATLPEKVAIIPCGVDPGLFHPMDMAYARRQLGLGEGQVLLFVGRMDPLKGLHLLLQAAAQLRDRPGWQLLAIGGDLRSSEVQQFNAQASQAGLCDRVKFLGSVAHEMLPYYYSAADVCVVPSYYESFGLVAVEALACGTPLVASRVGGLATTVRHGETGYLVNELSPQAFARALQQVLEDEPQRLRFAGAAPASVARYHWSDIARQMLDLYVSMVDPLHGPEAKSQLVARCSR